MSTNENNFYMFGHFKDGVLDDLGVCPGQDKFLEKILEDAEAFTNEHHGGRQINVDMLDLIKRRFDDNKFYEAVMGAYSLGYENGYLKAKESTK